MFHSLFPLLLLLGIFLHLIMPPSPISALQCYTGQNALTAALSGSTSQCPAISSSCTKSIDYTSQMVVRQCQSGNCTNGNGTQNPQGGCVNSTITNSTINLQTYCCCYGDGCNLALNGPIPQFALISTSILGAAAILFFWL